MQTIIIEKYNNNAEVVADYSRNVKKTKYNTGDIVYTEIASNKVLCIIPHDTKSKLIYDNNINLFYVDQTNFPQQTPEASKHLNQLEVLNNLKINPNYYNELVSIYVNEKYISTDMVKRFFDFPQPNREVRLKINKVGTCGFDININVSQNPNAQKEAMKQLDDLLIDKKWLSSVCDWFVNYEIGTSYRFFSGDAKEAQIILQKWIKNCENKIGKKNIIVE